MTRIKEIMWVSGVQFYTTSFVHCIVCLPPQAKSPVSTVYLPFTVSYLIISILSKKIEA